MRSAPNLLLVSSTDYLYSVDEVAKSSACLWETMSNPETGLSPETTKAPFNRAFDWPGSFWTWLGQPEQANRQRRFGVAMKGVSSLEPVDSILKGKYYVFLFKLT